MGTGEFLYTLHLADNAMILAQRNSEWCAHGPVLEQDIAITNISLDLLGQARNFYQYAATLYNSFNNEQKEAVDFLIPGLWKIFERELNEDDLVFLRNEKQYLNFIITELPNGDWGTTVLRQFLVSAFQYYQFSELKDNSNVPLAAAAAKSVKEVTYHLRWSSEWVIRLGDGTVESNLRIRKSLDELWPFTEEFFAPVNFDIGVAKEEINVDLDNLKQQWLQKVKEVLSDATLNIPGT